MKPAGPIFFIALLIASISSADNAPTDSNRHFLESVKPLLDSRCVSCHGPEKQKGNLRLDSRPALLKGGDTGPSLIPGKPDQSLILQAVTHAKRDLEMPPKEKLTPKDIAVLEQWIRDGAPWPEAPTIASTQPSPTPLKHIGNAWSDPNNPIVKIFGGQRLDLWSLKPIQRPTPPPVRTQHWPRNSIDPFILAKLEAANLLPSPEADKRTLIRRLSYDLTGLPPTPGEVRAFLLDNSPQAHEQLVDRLLASPRYGEHQARQWLDVVRYSDSNGFDWDEYRPNAWRFRDYVVRSFNADKPFDQFVREQLAGDELLDGAPNNAAEQDFLIATGYLRIGPQDNSSALFNEQARSRAELMADLVETTGSAFLGLTLSCCRCHDHKFDPLSQADHFRIRAFFEPAKYDDRPIDLADEQAVIRKQHESIDAQTKPIQAAKDALLKTVKDRLTEEKTATLTDEERNLLALPDEKRTGELKGRLDGIRKKIEVRDKDVLASLIPEQKKAHDALTKPIDDLKKQKRPFATALMMTDGDAKAVTRILYQGNHKDERDPVPPGFISALDPNPATIAKPTNPKTSGRRLALANWITSSENPLTARVLANRIWQSHFPQGLVPTPNDFGLAGAPPTHPELLDHLATELHSNNWSLKHLHRLIVTSATYRMSATSNQQRATGNSLRRLTAEQLRDSLLAVSGLLLPHDSGPPIWPELPPEVLQANPAFLDDNAEKTKGWYPSPPEKRNVRGLFLIQKRTVRLPFMETFDLPENNTSCPQRNSSVVPPQALTLLNGPLTLDASRALAKRLENLAPNDPTHQIRHAFQITLQRPPTPDELQACLKLLTHRSLPELSRALLNLNEFIYID